MGQIIVIGAGIGGLTTGAVLAKAGHEVTVLEAHIYPGGCAGTFFHQDYHFDAGATLLAGFYPGGPMDMVAGATGISHWPVRPIQKVMTVHLPEGYSVDRWANETRWLGRQPSVLLKPPGKKLRSARRAHFGEELPHAAVPPVVRIVPRVGTTHQQPSDNELPIDDEIGLV